MANLGNIGQSVGGDMFTYQHMYSGTGTISGNLQQNGTSCNAMVWLYDEGFYEQLDFAIKNGSYSFVGLKSTLKYTIVAQDIDSGSYNKLIYRNVTPS